MSHSKEIISYMNRLGSEAKEASSVLAQASIEQRNASLDFIAEAIELNRDKILSTNQKDLELAKQKSIGSALIDRLELNDNRIDSMISGFSDLHFSIILFSKSDISFAYLSSLITPSPANIRT